LGGGGLNVGDLCACEGKEEKHGRADELSNCGNEVYLLLA